MQVLRQCSVCACRAAGGNLLHQTSVSLLRHEDTLRRGAGRVRFLSISGRVVFRGRRPRAHTLDRWRDNAHISMASLSSGPHAPSFTQQVGNLSHDSLIRRALSMVTDSSSTYLSQSTLALTDALSDYSKAVYSRIAVQRQYLASLGKLTPAEGDSFQQLIDSQRAQVRESRAECRHFESIWNNSVNLSEMAAEAAQTSGAEQASVTLKTNIQVAQAQVEEARKLSVEAEKRLAETKVEEIQRMAEYAAFRENNEEHELHEAYLRED
ncbi:diablo IAP-binding mitochondrial protein-like [Brachionichthys hirsutus]|uniref:diablo IAP-binding mitochondrial protein-like n=1 Tax=Brachionichthys hirsutus TaxID=412623 RepID=UPI0036047EEA